MQLDRKRMLAARTLNVGIERVAFNANRLDEIKEAITKQDIRDLFKDGAIFLREKKGTKTKEKRSNRRRSGSIKKNVKPKKSESLKLIRVLRNQTKVLRATGRVNDEQYTLLRKEIRSRMFKSRSQFKERLHQLKIR